MGSTLQTAFKLFKLWQFHLNLRAFERKGKNNKAQTTTQFLEKHKAPTSTETAQLHIEPPQTLTRWSGQLTHSFHICGKS